MYIVSIIFENGVKYGCKDIIFFTPYPSLVISMADIAADTSFMQAFANLFTVCH
jgi:hypothetical protein